MTDPEMMMSKLLSLSGPADGKLINDFLDALFHGYNMQAVSEMINSANYYTMQTGAWLVSELGKQCRLSDVDVAKLYESNDHYLRYVFLDYCINTKDTSDYVLNGIYKTLDDQDIRVRTRAIEWVANASNDSVMLILGKCLTIEENKNKITSNMINKDYFSEKQINCNRRLRALYIGFTMKTKNFDFWKDTSARGEDQLTLELLSKSSVKIRS